MEDYKTLMADLRVYEGEQEERTFPEPKLEDGEDISSFLADMGIA